MALLKISINEFHFSNILTHTILIACISIRLLVYENIMEKRYPGNEKIYERAASLKNVSLEFLKIEVWNNFNRIESSLISRY